MKDSEIMKRTEEIEKLCELLYILEKEKKQIERECKHRLVVITNDYNSYSIDAICMFCRKKFETNQELYGERAIVDVSEYIFQFGKDYVLSDVKELYDKIICSNPDLPAYKIANKIKEGLKEKYGETIKQLEEIARKIREDRKNIN